MVVPSLGGKVLLLTERVGLGEVGYETVEEKMVAKGGAKEAAKEAAKAAQKRNEKAAVLFLQDISGRFGRKVLGIRTSWLAAGRPQMVSVKLGGVEAARAVKVWKKKVHLAKSAPCHQKGFYQMLHGPLFASTFFLDWETVFLSWLAPMFVAGEIAPLTHVMTGTIHLEQFRQAHHKYHPTFFSFFL